MNFRSFSLYSDYSHPLTLSIVGEPSRSWIFKGPNSSSEREINRRCLSTSSITREIRHFYVAVVQNRERNVQKSVMHVRLVLLIKPIAFLTFSLSSSCILSTRLSGVRALRASKVFCSLVWLMASVEDIWRRGWIKACDSVLGAGRTFISFFLLALLFVHSRTLISPLPFRIILRFWETAHLPLP